MRHEVVRQVGRRNSKELIGFYPISPFSRIRFPNATTILHKNTGKEDNDTQNDHQLFVSDLARVIDQDDALLRTQYSFVTLLSGVQKKISVNISAGRETL